MKKEFLFVLIGGLFLLTYILEAIVNPLPEIIATPYDFLQPSNLTRYPFTTAIIALKSLAIFLTPLFLLSFLSGQHVAKAIILLVIAGLLQLYSLQDIVTGARLMSLEWSVSLAFGSAALSLPAIYFLLAGLMSKTKQKFLSPTHPSENPSIT